MKVKELIERLNEIDDDYEVYFNECLELHNCQDIKVVNKRKRVILTDFLLKEEEK